MDACERCGRDLPVRDAPVKRKRKRHCRACLEARRALRDPEMPLGRNLRRLLKRMYGDIVPRALSSPEAVRAVLMRYQYRSVLESGEDVLTNLSIVPFDQDVIPRSPDDLVVVSRQEAVSLGFCKTQRERASRFPHEIQQFMLYYCVT